MELEEHYVTRFKNLHEKKTGKQLSEEEARDAFHSLVRLVGRVYRPLPKTAGDKPAKGKSPLE